MIEKMLKKIYKNILEFSIITAGCLIYSLSFNIFIAPNNLVLGGINGLAIIINHFFNNLSVGFLYITMNVPLFLASFKHIGFDFLKNSIIGAVLVSIFLDLTNQPFLPKYTSDPLLAAIIGGLASGAGLGLLFINNASTGGSDIIGRMLNSRFKNVRIGRFILISDALIVALATVISKDINTALYSAVTIYLSTYAIDTVIYGTEKAKVAYIISEAYTAISDDIAKTLGRGGSLMDITGYYTGNKQNMIMCAVKRAQVGTLKRIVETHDKNAFFIIVNAYEVIGRGFEKRL